MGGNDDWPLITLYGDINFRPFRNIWMLEELGLPYLHTSCKPWSRTAKSVHPMGKVPSLVVDFNNCRGKEVYDALCIKSDRIVVLESAAINTYLGDLAREISKMGSQSSNNDVQILVPPPATPERAQYDSLAFFIMTEIDAQSLWIHRKHSDLSQFFGEAPGASKEAKRQFQSALKMMENELNSDYLISSFGFSSVDILFANCLFWAQQIGWLGKKSSELATAESNENENESSPTSELADIDNSPFPISKSLEEYMKRCRLRPAFIRANDLRKKQEEEEEKSTPKL